MTCDVIVVAGPTASGKTAYGIELAKKYNGEIVSADSMQVYKGMDIGTAKATAGERAEVAHHMIDVADPREDYSVARYVQEAGECCDEIISRGKIPVIVGGTGLYIDSLLSGRDFADSGKDRDENLRREYEREYEALGGEKMLERLREIDPERAAILNSGDKRRIVRALEVYTLTGETITAHDIKTRQIPPRYKAAYIVLTVNDRQELYRRINTRVDKMAQEGLFGEVQGLLDSGVSADCTAMQAIGYKEVVCALKGEISAQEALELIKQSSRRYAKRQITWFKRREDRIELSV